MQYAQQRNTNEQIQARGSIESRLLKDPVKTVADLRSSYRGCMDLIGLWSGLGSVLLKKEGWNEMEVKMACSLLGINPLIRCSREWTKLDRGMTADKARSCGNTQKISPYGWKSSILTSKALML
jgi:hypothetical protein